MRKNDLSEFKLEEEGFKITLRRGPETPAGYGVVQPMQPTLSVAPAPAVAPAPQAQAQKAAATPEPARENLREIRSTLVGTFYAAATPESGPYVTAGQEITEDTVVCIVEAMKVMNEIKAEMRGTIVEVVAENGKPVQYDQVLFRVR